ncbi:hypothetical protein PASE110613_08885 [Paenibacillus sediminis]|uniref:Cobalamin biosynthesis Mg chelatase CobN n=1 Tax=Paenibacillus sediminis TaxID=664909 RepID=A0ABS4H6A5_9BACL|nr:cobalamin biosynthesis Mg chelatase CobN [Paenibacillus sediminis]
MWTFISVIGFLAIFIFLIIALISLFKKNGRAKRNFLFSGIAFVIFLIGAVNTPSTETTNHQTPATKTAKTNSQVTTIPASNAVKKEEQKPAAQTKSEINKTEQNETAAVSGTKATSPAPTSTKTEQSKEQNSDKSYELKIVFPADKYPETATHIKNAIAKGESAVCTIDRKDADEHREESLKGIPTKSGYDRDEWPMAMCAEGGSGANIAYISPSDNRGAGSWVSNKLENYSDGTRVLFVISGSANSNISEAKKVTSSSSAPKSTSVHHSSSGASSLKSSSSNSTTSSSSSSSSHSSSSVYYKNCTAVREAGKAPLYKGDPGYSSKLDRDGDGVACE